MTSDIASEAIDQTGPQGQALAPPGNQPALPKPRPRPFLPNARANGSGFADYALGKFGAALLVPASLAVVALIAWVDHQMGPGLSCGILYLLPVAACAWWGGLPQGVLIVVAASSAWHMVDRLESPTISLAAGLWIAVVRFGTLTLAVSLVSRLHTSLLQERRLAHSDPLTGAANARTFYETVQTEVERAQRACRPLTLAYLDVDDFKQLNDRLGHAAGDDVLLHVVRTIQLFTRPSDLLARLGGDEFALLLPEQGNDGTVAMLVRLQRLLSAKLAQKGWHVTLSIGAVTFLPAQWDVDQMIRQIDTLMYMAKRKGKGLVEHAIARDSHEHQGDEKSWIERRGAVRIVCNRPAQVRWQEQGENEEQAAHVLDISADGIRLHLAKRIAPDTVLMVEPRFSEGKTLLVRVLYAFPDDKGWQHGCKLAARMNGEDMCAWLGSMPDLRLPEGITDLAPCSTNGAEKRQALAADQ